MLFKAQIFFLLITTWAQESPRPIEVGQSVLIDHLGAHHLRFNRKGIAEVLKMTEDSAEVLCLKPGIALVYFIDEAGSTQKKQTILCSKAESRIEEGITDSFKDWLQSRSMCDKKCIFDRKLSIQGQVELKKWLQQVLPSETTFEINAIHLKIYHNCPNGPKIAIPGAELYCKQLSNQRFLAKIKIVMFHENNNHLYQGGVIRMSTQQAEVHFRSLKEDSSVNILAQPQFLLSPDSEISLQNGGEFPELTEQGHTSNWKRFGLKITNKLKSNFSSLHLQSAYELSFKEGRSIRSHELRSEIPVYLGFYTLLGQGEILSRNETVQHPFGLDRVPILAPLFKEEHVHKGKISVQYWVLIEEDTSKGTKLGDEERKEESRRF